MIETVPMVTIFVATVNVAVVAPAATVTETGTVAALVLLLVNATTAPPAGAAALSVTVPVLFAPPVRLPGFSVIETSAALTEVVSRLVVAVAVALGVAVAVAGGVGVTVAVGVGVGASKPLTRMSWPCALKEPTKKSPVTGSMHAPSA